MNPEELIDKYCTGMPELRNLLLVHSRSVARKALEIADLNPGLSLDRGFLYEAAMLHDIGVFLCDAPQIHCLGREPYIRHGVLGARILRREGLPRHARVCERHTGAGLTVTAILEEHLPLPHRSLSPRSDEEKIICLADKFFSKTRPDEEKTIEEIRRSILKFGPDSVRRFDALCRRYLGA